MIRYSGRRRKRLINWNLQVKYYVLGKPISKNIDKVFFHYNILNVDLITIQTAEANSEFRFDKL